MEAEKTEKTPIIDKHSKIPKKDRDLYWVGDMDFDEKTTDFLMKYTISDEGTKLDTAESWLARSKIIFQGLDPFKFQNLNHKMLIELCLPKTVEKVVETTMENTLAADVLFTGKDLFDPNHNPSHSTLYPDVLKIKKQ